MKVKAERGKLGILMNYKWSSLPGYIKKSKKEKFIDYEKILGEYGGDNDRGRQGYR